MYLGLFTDSVPDLPFEAMLDLAAETGATSLEIATGGQSPAPHLDLAALVGDRVAQRRLSAALSARGLRIEAINCSAWPMHPVVGERDEELVRNSIRLAGELEVTKVVTMSGCPGDGPAASTLNWVWFPWPEDSVALRDRQWERAVPLWQGLAGLAAEHGVTRLAFELHPLHLAYNVPTLLTLREAVGPVVGANVDPSHMFWQQMDPLAVVRALGDAVHHVHLKDTEIVADQVALAGVLDGRPMDDPGRRSWIFRTVGRAHGVEFWSAFVGELAGVGYQGSLSIENEDPGQPPVEGVREAAGFMQQVLSRHSRAGSATSATIDGEAAGA